MINKIDILILVIIVLMACVLVGIGTRSVPNNIGGAVSDYDPTKPSTVGITGIRDN